MVKPMVLTLFLVSLSGCVSTGNSDKLASMYVKQDTPPTQFTSDWKKCRERVTSGEFQDTFSANQVAIGGDPLVQAFARGYAEGRQRALVTFLCLENHGYENIMVPSGTYKRIEALPIDQQISEANRLLAEQPRGKSAREKLFQNGS